MIAPEMIDHIIDEAFDVLAQIGLMFENDRALEILGEHDQRIDRENQRVWLDRSLVEKALASAPAEEGRQPARERAHEVVEEILGRERFQLPEETCRAIDQVVLRGAQPFGLKTLPRPSD